MRKLTNGLVRVGEAAVLAGQIVRVLPRPRLYLNSALQQAYLMGIQSLPLVLIMAFLGGAVTSQQTGAQFAGGLPLWVIGSVLAEGKTSRLYRRLVYEQQTAQDVSAFQSSGQLGSSFWIVVTARPGVDLDQMETAVREEVARIAADGSPLAEYRYDVAGRVIEQVAYATATNSALRELGSLDELRPALDDTQVRRTRPRTCRR